MRGWTVEGVDSDAIGCLQPDVFNFAFVGLRWREALRIAWRKVDEAIFDDPEVTKTNTNPATTASKTTCQKPLHLRGALHHCLDRRMAHHSKSRPGLIPRAE